MMSLFGRIGVRSLYTKGHVEESKWAADLELCITGCSSTGHLRAG